MAKRPVRRYEPKPKPAPQGPKTRGRAARPAAPAAKPAAPKISAYRPGAGKFGGTPTQPGFADAIAGAVANAIRRFTTTPLLPQAAGQAPAAWGGGKFGQIPAWAAEAQARARPPFMTGFGGPGNPKTRGLAGERYANLPRFGPVRQGTMTKARAPVTARPYVQLEPPAEEQMAAPAYAGAEPFYPYPDYGGGYPETGGGYGGGYGDGGGGGGAPREVPPWYYGLVSWRF